MGFLIPGSLVRVQPGVFEFSRSERTSVSQFVSQQPPKTPLRLRTQTRPCVSPPLGKGVALGRAARSGRPERRPRCYHCGRQDRGSPPVGLGPAFVGGPGGRVFEGGRGERRSGAEGGAGAGGELTHRALQLRTEQTTHCSICPTGSVRRRAVPGPTCWSIRGRPSSPRCPRSHW